MLTVIELHHIHIVISPPFFFLNIYTDDLKDDAFDHRNQIFAFIHKKKEEERKRKKNLKKPYAKRYHRYNHFCFMSSVGFFFLIFAPYEYVHLYIIIIMQNEKGEKEYV
jgi:hypothetical protein